MDNEKGFTLIEVLASLVIISLVLMSFMGIFANTNKLAVRNSEKLVVINLADAYLERVKVDPDGTINLVGEKFKDSPPPHQKFPPDFIECRDSENRVISNKHCYTVTLDKLDLFNEKYYDVTIKFSQTTESNEDNLSEDVLSLINVEVTVTARESKLSSTVEGYVPYGETNETN